MRACGRTDGRTREARQDGHHRAQASRLYQPYPGARKHTTEPNGTVQRKAKPPIPIASRKPQAASCKPHADADADADAAAVTSYARHASRPAGPNPTCHRRPRLCAWYVCGDSDSPATAKGKVAEASAAGGGKQPSPRPASMHLAGVHKGADASESRAEERRRKKTKKGESSAGWRGRRVVLGASSVHGPTRRLSRGFITPAGEKGT